jgi:hypothetical protein
LPPVNPDCPTYNCDGLVNPSLLNPMGELFYDQLRFTAGNPLVEAPDVPVGPFYHVQPSQYWTCEALTIQAPAEAQAQAPGELSSASHSATDTWAQPVRPLIALSWFITSDAASRIRGCARCFLFLVRYRDRNGYRDAQSLPNQDVVFRAQLPLFGRPKSVVTGEIPAALSIGSSACEGM